METPSVLNSVAYHLHKADKATIYFPKSRRPNFEFLPSPSGHRPASMGSLDLLPVEILHKIMSELDFQSLGTMRCLNRQVKATVETVSAYRDITTYCHASLCALSCAGLLSAHSAGHLHDTLYQDLCITCGAFGSFLFLPNAARCCLKCVSGRPEFRISSKSSAASTLGLNREDLSSIPEIQLSHPYKYRRSMICWEQAQEIATSKYGADYKAFIPVKADRLPEVLICCPFPYMDQQKRLHRGLCCRGCEFDYLKVASDNRYLDFHQWALRVTKKIHPSFTERGFLAHFEGCKSAKMLWDKYLSKGKSLEDVEELRVHCRTWSGLWESDDST
jgi:hypothetical protein